MTVTGFRGQSCQRCIGHFSDRKQAGNWNGTTALDGVLLLMRSPQYGKGRAIVAPDAAYASRRLSFDATVNVRVDASLWGSRAVGLHGPNAALAGKRIRYLEPKTVVYSDGTRGAAVLLNMHHKSGYRGLKVEGQRKRVMPTVTKRYAVAKK